jgi:hypothetical protein
MKRWWFTPRDSAWVRKSVRRVHPVVTGAVMAGALCFPISSRASFNFGIARTSGAVIEAWAFGTLSDARQPDSQAACDLEHVCELAISSTGGSGTGTGVTIKNALETAPQPELPPNLPFTMTETIEFAHPITKGVRVQNGQGACYPASGVMTIVLDRSSVLVLDILGQACQPGSDPAQLLLTGSYVTDSASTGEFVNADGIGSISINNPSGLPGTASNAKASLLGQLKLQP